MLNPIVTELTTAFTDILLCITALFMLLQFSQKNISSPWKACFALLAFSSFAAALAHGLLFSQEVLFWLWQPVYLSLGLMLAYLLIASIEYTYSTQTATKWQRPILFSAVIFYMSTVIFEGLFILFIIFEAIILLTSLGLYLVKRPSHYLLFVMALLLSLVAGGTQAAGPFVWHLFGLPFDHNSTFHLIQLVSLAFFYQGIIKTIARSSY